MAQGASYYFIGPNVGGSGGSFSNPQLGPNGTASAPTYSFTNAPNFGWYYDSTNGTLAAAASGFEALQASSTGTTSTLTIGTGTADSAGAIVLGTLGNANAVRLRKNGTGASFLVENAAGGAATMTVANMQFSGSLVATSGGLYNMAQMQWYYASQTSNYTVNTNTADVGRIFDNQGAGAQVVFTLGSTNYAGSQLMFFNQTTFGLQIKASGTDKIRFPGSDSTAGGTMTTTTIGASVMLMRTAAGIWSSVGAPGGTWVAA